MGQFFTRLVTGLKLGLILAAGLALVGCKAKSVDNDITYGIDAIRPATFSKGSQSPLERGRLHYSRGDYGLAEKYFRQAVEQNSNNPNAWIGLAATYDRLKRFDLADRSYKVVIKMVGYTVPVHNNLGYHYYLQGEMKKARKHFDAAHNIDPSNPQVIANLELLDAT